MNVLIVGAGRMGIRHAKGVLQSKTVDEITLADISPIALENAKFQLYEHTNNRMRFLLYPDLKGEFDIVILSSTANNRIETCRDLLSFSPKFLLIEKPIGQSIEQVNELSDLISSVENLKAFVNLNMRLYPFVNELKQDLNQLSQFIGLKYINFTGGTLGIGANGIHYLDLIYYLLDADEAEIIAASIDDTLIPSGRGENFNDFGGWASMVFKRKGNIVGKSLILLNSTSSVFGGWEIIGTHGRIRINELEGERVDILRIPESQMPINRYAADYQLPIAKKIEIPSLSDLTKDWIDGLIQDKYLLPSVNQSIKVHQLMFDWLSHSKTHLNAFPIT